MDRIYEERCAWRCTFPAVAINAIGRHQADVVAVSDFLRRKRDVQTKCDAADLIIIYRNLFGETLKAIEYWKSRGKIVIGDIDYAYQLLDPTHPEYNFWFAPHGELASQSKNGSAPITEMKWAVQLVDFLTVASRRLVDDWQTFTKAIFLPDFIHYERYATISRKSRSDLVIGWKGTIFEFNSLQQSGALDAIREVIRLRPEVKLLLCSDCEDVKHQAQIPLDNLVFHPFDLYTWPEVLGQVAIGVAPLVGEVEQRKSSSDLLEYLMMKIPWIASAGSAFHDLSRYGWLVKNQKIAWLRVMMDMIDHYHAYSSEAEREPYLYGISQGIHENVQAYLELFAEASSR